MIQRYSDTHPEVEEFHVSLLRQASISERTSRMRSLSLTSILLSRRAILRANPGLSRQELNLIIMAYHYGTDLADRLRNYLKQRDP